MRAIIPMSPFKDDLNVDDPTIFLSKPCLLLQYKFTLQMQPLRIGFCSNRISSVLLKVS